MGPAYMKDRIDNAMKEEYKESSLYAICQKKKIDAIKEMAVVFLCVWAVIAAVTLLVIGSKYGLSPLNLIGAFAFLFIFLWGIIASGLMETSDFWLNARTEITNELKSYEMLRSIKDVDKNSNNQFIDTEMNDSLERLELLIP